MWCPIISACLLRSSSQLSNIFGSTRHGPRSVFKKHAKFFNNGVDLNLVQPSECRMAGEVFQFMRVLRLKEALQATTRDKVFVDYKRFGFVAEIINNEKTFECLFAIVQVLYPIFRILRLADMKIGGADKLYYYVMQTNCLLDPALKNMVEHWNDAKMPKMDFNTLKLNKTDKAFLKGSVFWLYLLLKFVHCDCI